MQIDNDGKEDLRGREQNKFSKNVASRRDRTQNLCFIALMTEVSRHVLDSTPLSWTLFHAPGLFLDQEHFLNQ